uniref:cardiotrophin-2 n=1 Tax=Pristiophorus japonicus TaxID=55135 RepID=UPI00398F7E35
MEYINNSHLPRVLTRSMSRNVSAITHRTYKLVLELRRRSERLVDLYRRLQGPPFSRPGFQGPGDREEGDGDVEEGAWLRAEHRAYSGLARDLALVLEEQRELNPGRASLRLLDELAYFAVNTRGLAANLEQLLAGLGPGPSPPALPPDLAPSSNWEKKLRGLEVCVRCSRCLGASEEGFAALVAKSA